MASAKTSNAPKEQRTAAATVSFSINLISLPQNDILKRLSIHAATYAISTQNFTASWTTLSNTGCSQAPIQVWTPIEENGGHGKASSSMS